MKNFWFQLSGSRSEKAISVPITPVTRQCAARIGPVEAAGTATASDTFRSGKRSDVRSAHFPLEDCSAASIRWVPTASAPMTTSAVMVLMSLLIPPGLLRREAIEQASAAGLDE